MTNTIMIMMMWLIRTDEIGRLTMFTVMNLIYLW